MTLDEAMAALEAAGTEQNRKTYRRHGARDPMFGASAAATGALVKSIRRDTPLARKLWATGNHDARVLATFIADPADMVLAELDAWVRGAENHVLVDAVCRNVAIRSPHAHHMAAAWTADKGEHVAAAGWTLAGMLADGGEIDDSALERMLGRIEAEIHTAPNRTRHAMNGALIGIGCRGSSWTDRALAAARRIGTVRVDHGETACKTPDAATYIAKTLAHRAKKKPGAKKKKKT